MYLVNMILCDVLLMILMTMTHDNMYLITEPKRILLQCVLDYPNLDYPYPDFWTSAHVAMFSVPAGKRRSGHWSFATGESKAARTTFPNATTLFHDVRDLDQDLQRPS